MDKAKLNIGPLLSLFIRFLSLTFFLFDLGFMARQDYYIHFEPSWSLDGAKMGDPLEKPHDHLQVELGLSHMWPELGFGPQRWDDEWFKALKISVFNYLAMGSRPCLD